MASIPAPYWSTTRHGSDLSLQHWGSLDFCGIQWNYSHIYVLLLCLHYHEVGISFTKTIDYISTNHTIHYRPWLLCLLLFHRRLLENPRKAFCVLLHVCLCLDEPSHVPQLFPNNIPQRWKRKIKKDRVEWNIAQF